MRKILKKLSQKINNSGSGVILVIVALTFIGVLVGALLTAVGYVYKMKLYDYNARDNFYYVEQAMNEIYAGVGTRTVDNMEKAYQTTMDQMVRYDLATGEYVNLGNSEANELFDRTFLDNVATDEFFTTDIANSLAKCISNKSVYLDATKLKVTRYDTDGNVWDPTGSTELAKLVIENVTVTRTADYERSQANGQFKQTLSADIEISKPDFDVEFNNTTAMNQDLFNFAIIADAGVEVNKTLSSPLTIKGNIYAAADFYNKDYNYVSEPTLVDYSTLTSDDEYDYKINSVSTLGSIGDGTTQFNYNHYLETMGESGAGEVLMYDGVNELSRYSGLYINHSDVTILADTIIVPGTIAVMNTGKFSAYAKTGEKITNSSIWTDNFVLDGYSATRALTTPDSKGHTNSVTGAQATVRAYLYVKDDTELNAAGSKLTLNGSYYGFGNSTVADDRSFINGVDSSVYKYTDSKGNQSARGHYNSSAIIVNGERSTLDLTNTSNIFLAGKTYIELSKKVNSDQTEDVVTGYDDDGNAITETVKVESYVYDANTKDYKTGESLSIKSNQVAYIPLTPKSIGEVLDGNGNHYFWGAVLSTELRDSELFTKHFGDMAYIPCIKATVSGKNYYYYDFDVAYTYREAVEGATFTSKFNSAEELAESFITDYVAELNNKYSAIKEYLTDITSFEDFDAGDIKLPSADAAKIYSSGAMTSISDESTDLLSVKDGVEFNIASNKNIDITTILKNSDTVNKHTTGTYDLQALDYSSNFEKHYNYVKWCLTDIRDDSAEAQFVDKLVADTQYGKEAITPINRYMNFDKITTSTVINPSFGSESGDSILDLVTGDKIWVSNGNVTIKANSEDTASATVEDGTVSGIIICKGDVFFGQSVRKFEGMIIAGGKVYINNNVTEINSNPQLIKKILSTCQIDGSDNAKLLLSLFKGYEDSALERDENDEGARTIDTLDYTDVVRYSNWMKNVE